jgi:hypothetical protein
MASSSRSDGAGGKKAGARKRRGKSETGVITVKRAGVLPREARARSAPAPEVVPEAAALPQTIIEDTTEEMSLAELAIMTTAMVSDREAAMAAFEEGAPPLAEVVMPPLDLEPPPAAPKGMEWLMSKIRQWSGLR